MGTNLVGWESQKLEIDGEPCLKIDVTAGIDAGTQTLVGDAIVGFGET